LGLLLLGSPYRATHGNLGIARFLRL